MYSCCAVPKEMGLPPLRGYLLDQDEHQESWTQQEFGTQVNFSTHEGSSFSILRFFFLIWHIILEISSYLLKNARMQYDVLFMMTSFYFSCLQLVALQSFKLFFCWQ